VAARGVTLDVAVAGAAGVRGLALHVEPAGRRGVRAVAEQLAGARVPAAEVVRRRRPSSARTPRS
jgi:hypothetical protein